MKNKVDVFFDWFQKLTDDEKKQVLAAVTDTETIVQRGMYSGPFPTKISEGRYSGPAPVTASSIKSICSKCGRAY